MTPSATRAITKAVIKRLIRLAIRYGKGELQGLKPSVWDEYIGRDVLICSDQHREILGKLVEVSELGVTLDTPSDKPDFVIIQKGLSYFPNPEIHEWDSGLPIVETSTPMPKVKPPRRKVPDNPKPRIKPRLGNSTTKG